MQTSHHKHCQYSIRLIEKLKSLDTKNVLDFELINKAIYWAKKYHDGQLRKSGEPFYSHPLEVAYMISDYNLKTDVIAASILHDIIEDTEVTVRMIQNTFGQRIAEMVDRLTRDRPDGSKLSVGEILNNSYQEKDREVLLIKLFDRLHNMQTLGVKSPEKIKKIADETLLIFVALAIYLEVVEIKQKLSALCIKEIFTQQGLIPPVIQNTFSFVNSCLSFPQDFQNEIEQIYKLKE
jgi:(p)ppGpp synthase/HD superfamily hydrolase